MVAVEQKSVDNQRRCHTESPLSISFVITVLICHENNKKQNSTYYETKDSVQSGLSIGHLSGAGRAILCNHLDDSENGH